MDIKGIKNLFLAFYLIRLYTTLCSAYNNILQFDSSV